MNVVSSLLSSRKEKYTACTHVTCRNLGMNFAIKGLINFHSSRVGWLVVIVINMRAPEMIEFRKIVAFLVTIRNEAGS